VPVIAFHGLEDQVVPYQGGSSSRDERFVFPPVEDWAATWGATNGCADHPLQSTVTDHINRLEYQDCQDGAQVIFYRVSDGGHTWPGGDKLPVWIAGYTNQEINASALMWEFFEEHPFQR
jgi:polyhydroxybutyrate depolymerase